MINHILADGRRLSSIEGFRIPYNKDTDFIYRAAVQQILRGGDRHGKGAKQALKAKAAAETY